MAIVGAPNVGKSTLFNRLTRRRRAIVTDEPGVTRDRLYGVVQRDELSFRLVDTGGLTPNTAQPFAEEIERQAETALREADLILFVIDARAGVTGLDRDVASMLRRRGAQPLVVANKIDAEKLEHLALDLHEFGFGPPIALSAEHDRNVDELLEAIAEQLPRERVEVAPEIPALHVAIFGRPNVGKSSLLNRLCGEERALVSEIPGTTRDAVDTLIEFDGKTYRMIDTAGIRKRGRIMRGVERFSVGGAHRNIDRCDVAILVLDGSQPFAAQDAHIAGYLADAYKPMLVVVNKWDLISDRKEQAIRWAEQIRDRLRFAKEVPMLLASAKTGQRVSKILDHADQLHAAAGIRVPTPALNQWLARFATPGETASASRKAPRIFYVTQVGIRPPRFLFFCNEPKKVHFSLRRRLANGLREHFGFGAAPIRLEFRSRREGRSR